MSGSLPKVRVRPFRAMPSASIEPSSRTGPLPPAVRMSCCRGLGDSSPAVAPRLPRTLAARRLPKRSVPWPRLAVLTFS